MKDVFVRVLLILYFQSICFNVFTQKNKTFLVPLRSCDSTKFLFYEKMKPSLSLISNEYFKIPNDINEYKILELHLQIGQFYKNLLTNTKVDKRLISENVIKKIQKFNTYYFSNNQINESVKILSFYNKQKQRCIVIDTDNDYSFLNEHVFSELELKSMKIGNLIQKFIRVNNIEYFDTLSKSIIKTNVDIYPELYTDVFPEIKNPIVNALLSLEVVSKQIVKCGFFEYNEKKYPLIVFSHNLNNLYDSSRTMCFFLKDSSNFMSPRFNKFYNLGKTISIDNMNFRAVKINIIGEWVEMRKVE